MACIIVFVFIFCISNTYCDALLIQPQPKSQETNEIAKPAVVDTKQNESSKQNEKADPGPVMNVEIKSRNEKPKEISEILTTSTKTPNVSNIKNNTNADIEGGAVLRGVFVFVGITLLLIMYLTCKTYRKRNKKNVLIRKYGVKTRRTDVEMEPLPLDDDEEDETVFDLGNVNNR